MSIDRELNEKLALFKAVLKSSPKDLKFLKLLLPLLSRHDKSGGNAIYEYAVTKGSDNFKILHLFFYDQLDKEKQASVYQARKKQVLEIFQVFKSENFNFKILSEVFRQIDDLNFPIQVACEFNASSLNKIKVYFSNVNRLSNNFAEIKELLEIIYSILGMPKTQLSMDDWLGEGIDCVGLDFMPNQKVGLKIYSYYHSKMPLEDIKKIVSNEFIKYGALTDNLNLYFAELADLEYKDWGFLYRVGENAKPQAVKAWYRLAKVGILKYLDFPISYLTFDDKGQGIYFRENCSQPDEDDLFKGLTGKISQTDFSGYTIQYPPLFTWPKAEKLKSFEAWQGVKPADRLGLYIHVPFCQQKCHFCRYFSKEEISREEISKYLAYLEKEMSLYFPYFKNKIFHSLYIGGGTPSILDNQQLLKLFELINKNFQFRPDAQKCIEVNPTSTSLSKLKLLKSQGVNRLTIGVQTLNEDALQKANRQQTKKQALLSIIWAKELHFDTVNIDLMAGLPGETLASFELTLKNIVSLRPEMVHIHPFYPTTNTQFVKQGNELSEQDLNLREQMTNLAARILAESGYQGTKFDAFGLKANARNRQLSEAIEFVSSYIGFGPGAVSHLKDKYRYVNFADLNSYYQSLADATLPIMNICHLTLKDEMIYYVTACLRYGPVDKNEFKHLFNHDLDQVFSEPIAYLAQRGLLFEDKDSLTLKTDNLSEYSIYSKYFFDPQLLTQVKAKITPQNEEIAKVYL